MLRLARRNHWVELVRCVGGKKSSRADTRGSSFWHVVFCRIFLETGRCRCLYSRGGLFPVWSAHYERSYVNNERRFGAATRKNLIIISHDYRSVRICYGHICVFVCLCPSMFFPSLISEKYSLSASKYTRSCVMNVRRESAKRERKLEVCTSTTTHLIFLNGIALARKACFVHLSFVKSLPMTDDAFQATGPGEKRSRYNLQLAG